MKYVLVLASDAAEARQIEIRRRHSVSCILKKERHLCASSIQPNRTVANRDGLVNRFQNILNCLFSVAWADSVLSVIEIIYERS